MTQVAQGHQPDLSSAMLVDRGSGNWILQINSSLTALQYEVKSRFGENAYSSPAEFQQLVNQHMRRSINLVFNGTDTASISNSFVKLGHSSSVVLELNNVPSDVLVVAISIESFKDINRNKCAFGIVQEGTSSAQIMLSNTNGHQTRLAKENGKFVSKPESVTLDITKYHYLSFAILICALGVVGFQSFRARRSVVYQ